MEDLVAEAGLITVQMCDILGWLVEPLIRIKAGAITARKLDTLLVNAPRKLKMRWDKCDTILWAKEYPSLKTGRSKNGMMTMLGALSI